jgi:hypothetical protein
LNKISLLDLDVDVGNKNTKRPVIWADAGELLEFVLQQRKETNNVFIKIMADGGQGFFKICMSVFPENYLKECSEDKENMSPQKKRTSYVQGGSVGSKGQLTGVKRFIMVCIVPEIKETYENIQKLFSLTNINNIPFKFVSDFKII